MTQHSRMRKLEVSACKTGLGRDQRGRCGFLVLVIGLASALVSLVSVVVHAGGGGCSGNGCIQSGSCEIKDLRGTLVPFDGFVDSLSLMGDPVPLSPTTQESEWITVDAQGSWDVFGDVLISLNEEPGPSTYVMTSQSPMGSPFFPADVEIQMFWRVTTTNPVTGDTLELTNNQPAIYAATGVTSFPPSPGTVFQLTSTLVTSDAAATITCTSDPGASSVVYSGQVLDQPILINEVDVSAGGGGLLQFIELYDGGAGSTPLDGAVVVLFDGTDDLSYGEVFDLTGHTTDAQGFFVIGGPEVDNADITKSTTLVDGPGAIALYNLVPNPEAFSGGASITTVYLFDAFVYGPAGLPDAGLLGLLRQGQQQIVEGAGGDSVLLSSQRFPDGGGLRRDTRAYTQAEPTPGVANSDSTFLVPSLDGPNALFAAILLAMLAMFLILRLGE